MSERGNRTGRRGAVRVDPRAEPASVPPAAPTDVVGPAVAQTGTEVPLSNASTGERPVAPGAKLGRVDATATVTADDRDEPDAPAAHRHPGYEPAAPPAVPELPLPPSPRESPRPASAPRSVVSNADPRYEEIEPLLARSDWDGIRKALGPIEHAGALPPGLGLVLALAQKELVQGPAAQRENTPENDVAIRCVSRLLGVPEDSAVALVLAKRMLRRHPVAWRGRPAPRGWASMLIVLVGIALGALLGYALAFGPLAGKWSGAPAVRRAFQAR